jgi:hypothetical protein
VWFRIVLLPEACVPKIEMVMGALGNPVSSGLGREDDLLDLALFAY